MLLVVTILCGAMLGLEAGREGPLAIGLPAVAAAVALTMAAYLRFLVKDWRKVLGQVSARGLRAFQWDSLRILAWSFVFRVFVMSAAGVLVYWIWIILH
jgi:hypothetical protein